MRKLIFLLLLPAAVFAQREPVLKQIDLPHPYYYREMYLPQLTSGPSWVTWSPDSKEIIYSMAGSLWRQKLDSTEAVQLTDEEIAETARGFSTYGLQTSSPSTKSAASAKVAPRKKKKLSGKR